MERVARRELSHTFRLKETVETSVSALTPVVLTVQLR
jgi:hypothetical protein